MIPTPPTDRRRILDAAHTVVVKVGTNVLADPAGHLDAARVHSLAAQVARARSKPRRVVLVTSGAIGAGVGRLGLSSRPTDLPHLQACAAVGQSALMQLYQEGFAKFGLHAAQLLLTAGDFDSRTRYLNARHTLNTLFGYPCVPVINENDTVSVAEIRFGDNDKLAAMVANLLLAPLLVLLTNVDGLYSADPTADPSAKLLDTVPHIDAAVSGLAGATKSRLGTGGMASKLAAARLATGSGGAVVVANGGTPDVLDRVLAGESVGTLFLPHADPLPARKRWLGLTANPAGDYVLDAGAAEAVAQRGKSLLPVGVVAVVGEFQKGDVVRLLSPEGAEVGRGLSNYSASDARQVIGRKAGGGGYAELVHRDHLVRTGGG